jgi:hypothetical protein
MHDSNEKDEKKQDMNEKTGEIDNASLSMNGHIIIRDKDTGEEFINKRNAIHYGNMARIVAQALNNTADSYINFIAFGNGGTSVDSSGGKVIYRSPRVSESYEASASLYNKTYHKDIHGAQADDDNKIEIITGASYTDIKMTVTLAYSEPSGQDVFDSSTTNQGDFIFDEMGVFTTATDFNNSQMLTHVIFHPVQKSQNRVIEIIYTIRVQLS